jgi:hypothetical protein
MKAKPKLIERHAIMVNGPIAKVMAMDPIDHIPNNDYGVQKLKRRILQNKTTSAIKRPMY